MSKTPVREALQVLAHNGLVEVVPRRGTFVARISLEDAVEVFRMREALEGMAARLAAPHIDDVRLDELEASLKRADSLSPPERADALYRAGGEVHDAILLACGSKRIRDADNAVLHEPWDAHLRSETMVGDDQ